jgi:hypothetical protein
MRVFVKKSNHGTARNSSLFSLCNEELGRVSINIRERSLRGVIK